MRPGPACGLAQCFEFPAYVAATWLGRFLVARVREHSQQRIQVEIFVGVGQTRSQPVPEDHVRRHPHRQPALPIGPRRIVGDVRHAIAILRSPSVVIAAAVVGGHHQHVTGLEVTGADRAGARIVHASPAKCPAVGPAQVHVEIVFARGHVGNASRARRCSSAAAIPFAAQIGTSSISALRGRTNSRILLSLSASVHVVFGDVAAPHQRDFCRSPLGAVQEQPDFRVRGRRRRGV